LVDEKILRKYVCQWILYNLSLSMLLRFRFRKIMFQNDLHRAMQKSQSALSQQLMILSATLLCLVFTRWVLSYIHRPDSNNHLWLCWLRIVYVVFSISKELAIGIWASSRLLIMWWSHFLRSDTVTSCQTFGLHSSIWL